MTQARLLTPADVRALAAQYHVRPTKQRGQNFVIDPNTVRRIVAAAGLGDDETVLEVGPGLGSLTLALLPVARQVIAVEIDPVLAQALPTTVADHAPDLVAKLAVVEADALKVDTLPDSPTALVANLPYNIAVPVLLHLLATFPSIERVLVMVQLEVADRLTAAPGTKAYGVPTLKASWFCDVRKAGLIGRNVFWPAPNVDSGLVAMTRHPPLATTSSREAVFAAVDAGLGQRRKMLRSALAGLAGSSAAASAALERAGIDPTLRGERLTIVEFARIADALDAGRNL